MKSYEELERAFKKDVEDLQERCDHSETTWMEQWWAPGHRTGDAVEVCDLCKKEVNKISLDEAYEKGYLEKIEGEWQGTIEDLSEERMEEIEEAFSNDIRGR